MANDETYWQNIARDQENERNNRLREIEAEQAALSARREQNVRDATGHINTSFDTQFNPDFYSGYSKQLMDYWRPDIDRQYGDAQRSLNYTYADAQPGGGSAPAEGFGRLKEAYQKALLSAGDNSRSQANQLRGNIEGQRSALLSSVTSDTDPNAAIAQTSRTISGIPLTPTYSPLGDIFSNVTGQFANAMQARYNGGPGWGIGPKGGQSSRGSEKTFD
jgi:hypothetical protein